MPDFAPSVSRLIDELKHLPGIGQKTAQRLAFFLLRADRAQALALADAIRDAKEKVRECSVCNNITDTDSCIFCSNPTRNRAAICVVEEATNIQAIERTRQFNGLYHVLGGHLSPLDGIGPEQLNIAKLIERASGGEAKEVLLALNATVEGQSTAHYVTEQLGPAGVVVSRLAQGVPIGGELDYLDEGTLAAAIKARRRL